MKNSINIHHKYNCRNPGRTLFSGTKEKFVWQVFSTFSYRYCITCCKLTSKFVGRVKVSASLTTCHIWFALCSFCILHTWRVFFVFINCIWVSILPIRRISIKKKMFVAGIFHSTEETISRDIFTCIPSYKYGSKYLGLLEICKR